MKVVVVGAGVAGVALARGLVAVGHEVEVYEQASGPRTAGGSVTLWSAGTGILRDLGVEVTGLGRRIDRLEQWSSDGRILFTADVSRAARRFGSPTVHVRRQHLVQALAAGLPPGVIRYGRRCTGVRGTTAVFADGGTARGDVLVGADGRWSPVRDHLQGGDPARPTGWVTWQGVTELPIDVTGSHRGVLINGREGLCGLMPPGDGLLLWWFDFRAGETPAADWPGLLAERFGGWASPVPEVLAAVAGSADAGFFAHYRQRVPRVWGRGGATLAGDSAHAMPPSMAQGVNQALEDAWALTAALTGPSAHPVAARLRAYERHRSRKAGLVAWVSGTSTTDRYRPPSLMRLVPDGLATRLNTAWLGRASTYLDHLP
ncbi:salicylate hydroxylase [Microtetraspora sp. NBRC 13810]|uniref:FAD-dependent oxidoreductase n=1 Tax=Microtetraspora sp. NBRC 13810 TaxID=3030990 RepID=UPI0024A1CC60|nr:FAD-dependent monooxygenase [Microtetraspora sp. NBRC 13810]GLW11930.1 salicylate hydroxylase [Microtetraspora sp. NBRC 13810]